MSRFDSVEAFVLKQRIAELERENQILMMENAGGRRVYNEMRDLYPLEFKDPLEFKSVHKIAGASLKRDPRTGALHVILQAHGGTEGKILDYQYMVSEPELYSLNLALDSAGYLHLRVLEELSRFYKRDKNV